MEPKYWYKVVLMPVVGSGPLVEYERVEVLEEDDTRVKLATVSTTGIPMVVVKSCNKGPYYPTPKKAATARLVMSLNDLADAEEACAQYKGEYTALLPYC